jgi:hypothetical protein
MGGLVGWWTCSFVIFCLKKKNIFEEVVFWFWILLVERLNFFFALLDVKMGMVRDP